MRDVGLPALLRRRAIKQDCGGPGESGDGRLLVRVACEREDIGCGREYGFKLAGCQPHLETTTSYGRIVRRAGFGFLAQYFT